MSTALITKNGGTSRRDQRSYSKLQQVTAVMLASFTGTADAGRTLDIPRRTLDRWVNDVGSLADLRAEAGHVLGHTMSATALTICHQLRLKAADMDATELTAALLALSASVTVTGLAEQGVSPGGNVVQILIGDKDHREVIEVNRPTEPSS